MLDQKEIKERFLKETKNHKMEVLMDNGVYRHLKFTNEGSQVYRFDIHTWPGYLCICQDMGTYVFSRVPDMFEFFNSDINKEYAINPGYWGEKLQAVDGNRNAPGYEEFSQEIFEEHVWEEFKQFSEEHEGQIEDEREEIQDELLRDEVENVEDVIAKHEVDKTKPALTKTEEKLAALKEALQEEVIDLSYDGNTRAYDAAMSFNWEDDDKTMEFNMHDFWDHNCTDYTYHYIWILYAIVYSIGEYDKSKAVKAA